MTAKPLSYRLDIDGLRAIAILLVFLHHLELPSLSGGFVGVDIFFVISGFLITRIISHDLLAQQFNFSRFYQRRIHRLAPAFFLVVLITLGAASLLMLPPDLLTTTVSAQWSAVGLANVFMWKTYGGYFSGESSEAPFLHLWSLAVEEQFYLLWPLFLFLSLRFVKAQRIGLLVLGLFLASALLSHWWTAASTQGGSAFFLLPPRAQELLLGAVAYFASTHKSSQHPHVKASLRMAGLALILYSAVGYTESTSFPGPAALVPCIGAAVLLALKPELNDWSHSWLGHPWMVYFGKISYPMYLWHWPLIGFVHYWLVNISWAVAIGTFLLTWLLSDLTWRYLEKPLRPIYHLRPWQSISSLLLLPTALVFILCILIQQEEGFYSRFIEEQKIKNYYATVENDTKTYRGACHVNRRGYAHEIDTDQCRLGDTGKATVDGLIIGDSFANHYTPMLDEMARRQGLRLSDYTMNECRPLKGFDINPECLVRNKQMFQHISESAYRFIVLGGAWARSNEATLQHNQSMDELFKETIKLIVESGSTPIIITRTPTIPHAPTCNIKQAIARPHIECGLSRSIYDRDNAYFNAILKSTQSEYPQIKIIDVAAFLCDSEMCQPQINGLPIYSDNLHLNAISSRKMGELLWQQGQRLPAPD